MSTIPNVCEPCQLAKSKQLPFPALCRIAKGPLDTIHTDVWTSPVLSISGCKYYVSFINEYSRFTWLFPLHAKSDVFACFIKFKSIVENQFSCKIKILQSDDGGEYSKTQFQNYLTTNGILPHISCPHTPQQNGISERKHRHIVETGLALLAQSHLHTKYWVDAFNTAVYLINRLPTPILHNVSPFFKLLQIQPNYSLLKVFGCSCFPLLRPYNAHKLLFRSKKCIFLGYSANHRGYRCLDPSNSRIYISRNVVFNETSFPAKDMVPHSSDQVSASPASLAPFLHNLGYSVANNNCAGSSPSSSPSPCPSTCDMVPMDLNMTPPVPLETSTSSSPNESSVPTPVMEPPSLSPLLVTSDPPPPVALPLTTPPAATPSTTASSSSSTVTRS